MANALYQEYGRHDLSEVPCLPPIITNMEFPPLSQQTGFEAATIPSCNPVDQIVLEKSTPILPGQEECKVEKDLCPLLSETEAMINCGSRQVRHLNAITLELKLLLEYEQRILQQVLTRIEKFKILRDENKRKSIEWEEGYKAKMPECDSYCTKLVNVPHTQTIAVEGVPGPVQQKILFQIVSKTINTANRIVVQLSMEEAVANDIDLTLSDIKKHCTVMLKQIQSWLRNLKTQECSQSIVLDRWNDCKTSVKDLKAKGDAIALGPESNAALKSSQLKPYDDRLRRIEEALCKLCGPPCGTCKSDQLNPSDSAKSMGPSESDDQPSGPLYVPSHSTPGKTMGAPSGHKTPGRTRGAAPGHNYQGNFGSPACDPTRASDSFGSPGGPGISPHAISFNSTGFTEDPYLSPMGPGTHSSSFTPPGPAFHQVHTPPDPQVICPPGGAKSPGTSDYFGIPRTPPPASAWNTEPMEYDEQGTLLRNRAPPGTYPDINLVDTPGIGYPVPLAALERGGRPLGHTTPLSPPSPPPRQMGRFQPLATSSPPGVSVPLRTRDMPSCIQPHPMAGQPVDPALLPKIQDDLKKLADKNRNLQGLVNDFKRMRATLTDEIDKAVRLNQKLQRDLYYVAGAPGQ